MRVVGALVDVGVVGALVDVGVVGALVDMGVVAAVGWLRRCRSYGLYLVHWVLIVWFGDAELNTMHSEATVCGREPGLHAWARDFGILAVSVAIATASFYLYEVPLMKLGAKYYPSRVIATGLLSTVMVAVFVLMVTSEQLDVAGAGKSAMSMMKPAQMSTRFQSSAIGIDPIAAEAAWDVHGSTGPELSVQASQGQRAMLFFGDSQAVRIATLLKMTTSRQQKTQNNDQCRPNEADNWWDPKVINAAHGGNGFVQYFGVRNLTTEADAMMLKRQVRIDPPQRDVDALGKAIDAIEIIQGKKLVQGMKKASKQPYAFILDSHVMTPWESGHFFSSRYGLYGNERRYVEAIQFLIQTAAANQIRHLFLSTGTPFMWTKQTKAVGGARAAFETQSRSLKKASTSTFVRAADQQLIAYEAAVKMSHEKACNPNFPGQGDQVIHVTILQYHKLICPDAGTATWKEVMTAKNDLGSMQNGNVFYPTKPADEKKAQCTKSVYGFRDLLPDGTHLPLSDSGFFLAAQVQKIMGLAIARVEGGTAASHFLKAAKCADEKYGSRGVNHTRFFQTEKLCIAAETLKNNVQQADDTKQMLRAARAFFQTKKAISADLNDVVILPALRGVSV
jgi:hypothetical protein